MTKVVIIGRIVAETSFWRNVGIGSTSHCLLGEACKSLAILSIDAGGNDDNTLGRRGGLESGGMGEGLDKSLRRRVETLSEKNEVRSLCISRGDVGWGLMTE